MAIRMPSPVPFANGVYHLNVRVPKDLAARLRGTVVTLPVADLNVTVKIGDKVVASLRTKDPSEARIRFKRAASALETFLDQMRQGSGTYHPQPRQNPIGRQSKQDDPRQLSHKEAVALSGEHYRRFVQAREDRCGPDHFQDGHKELVENVVSWMVGDDGDEPMAFEDAEFLANLSLPHGPALVAWLGGGIRHDWIEMTEEEGLEDLFGREADRLVAKHTLVLDPVSRIALLRQIGKTCLLGVDRLKTTSGGDFSPDPNLQRFPNFSGIQKVTMADLFKRWKDHNSDKIEPSTIRRYTPTLNSFAAFFPQKDVRAIDEDDIWVWAEHRRDKDGIAARTVNRNDLVAISSVFTFATSRFGKRLIAANPAKGVKLDVPKAKKLRARTFQSAEIAAILTLARGVKGSRSYPRAAASRRWIPWMCAYLGCRVQEPCWLNKSSFRQEDGIWVVDFPNTKDGNARVVPLHDALIDEGLIEFVESAADGSLFVGDRARIGTTSRTMQEQRASEIAAWVQDKIGLEHGVDPNHGWRHTWITLASSERVNINKRHQNAINGHNKNKDASDGYCEFPIRELKAALDRFPRYEF